MNRDEYLARAAAGEKIETARELVHALAEVQRRMDEGSVRWYLMNRVLRWAMTWADAEEAGREPWGPPLP